MMEKQQRMVPGRATSLVAQQASADDDDDATSSWQY